MAVTHNIMNNMKLCNTPPIENAPKIDFFCDYLAIDDNNNDSNDSHMDHESNLVENND